MRLISPVACEDSQNSYQTQAINPKDSCSGTGQQEKGLEAQSVFEEVDSKGWWK